MSQTKELQRLRRGQRFHMAELGIEGKLIDKGIGCATVEIRRARAARTRTFRTRDGKQVAIRKPVERTTWSLQTLVEVGQ